MKVSNHEARSRRTRRWLAVGLLAVLAAAVLAACGGSGDGTTTGTSGGGSETGSDSGGGTLTVATFKPFTGPEAPFGPNALVGCLSAAKAINDAGGVLGNQIDCSSADSTSDPAEAVQAANQMIATTDNLVAVLGPSSSVAQATVPVINQAEVPMFVATGDSRYDENTDPYFWRVLPSDSLSGLALAFWTGEQEGHKTAAAVFGSDPAAQSSEEPVVKGYSLLGDLVADISVEAGATSYRTEASQIVDADPEALMAELDQETAATLFSQVIQQGGQLPPVMLTSRAEQVGWIKPVANAIGEDKVEELFTIITPFQEAPEAALAQYREGIVGTEGEVKDPQQYKSDPFSIVSYDSTIIPALAMVAADSTDPAVFNDYVEQVTQPAQGAVEVNTFAEGLKALEEGETIRYVGGSGPMAFNQYHNVEGGFQAIRWSPKAGEFEQVAVIPREEFNAFTEEVADSE